MTTLPKFDAAAFKPGTPINNPYFPLTPGTLYVSEGEPANEADDGSQVISRSAVTYQTKNVAGVAATVVRETSWADGFLEEDTNDFYAQDQDGNVWYLGEATTAFKFDDKGNFIGTTNKGAWEAGVNGAKPGFIMKANPQVGDSYYQEFAPADQAVDQAEVASRSKTLQTEVGTFSNGLQTVESTAVEPGVFENKYYAPGIGLVRVEEELDKNLKPGFVFELESITSVSPQAFTSGYGTQANDVIDGNDQSNILKGLQGNDLLQGFGGNDFLIGGDSNDFLIGGDGIDSLKGGNGQDILIGGAGADVLKGGRSRDQFVFRSLGDKGDLIQDFSRQDVIVLVEIFNSGNYGSANRFNDYLQIQQMGSRTVIRIDPDGDTGSKAFETLATLQNTNVNSLTTSHFVV